MKQVKALAAVSALALTLAACSSVEPKAGKNQTQGAGIGALAGAILGAAVSNDDDRIKGVLTGAALGGAVGAGVGHRLDRQEAELREQLAESEVTIERQDNAIKLVMPGSVTFDFDSVAIKPEMADSLRVVVDVLNQYPANQLAVEGFTDSRGDDAYNQALSERRAQAVANFLTRYGVSRTRLGVSGHGERFPIASNDTAEGREQNRRVELTIIGETQSGDISVQPAG